ncbi:MAG: lytic transglycosylase domain-containing protein [Thiohalocapsa sp.]|nr:lytic transglycosylase domain-containing protein [Thiohalocapsa sp.]
MLAPVIIRSPTWLTMPAPLLDGARRALLHACALAAGLVCAAAAADSGTALPAQRSAFLEAERGLRAGADVDLDALRRVLGDYPLLPYLQAEALLNRLDVTADAEVTEFIERHRGSAPGERVRRKWLALLSREKRWQAYVDSYLDNGSETRACRYRRALLETGRTDAAFEGLAVVYLTGGSLPDDCDPVFSAWASAGGLDAATVWQRVDLALAAGNAGVAAYQRRYLPAGQRTWLDRTLAVYRNPETLTDADAALPADPARRAEALTHALERLARRAPREAARIFSTLATREPWPPASRNRVNAAIGGRLARAGERDALFFLAAIEPLADQTPLQRERLRAALHLRARDWLPGWIEVLPAKERGKGEWQYWRARAAAETGDLKTAAHAFAEAAGERSLWGFRAAELLGRAPALGDRPAPAQDSRVAQFIDSETVSRIRELGRLGRGADISREWRAMTSGLSQADLIAAAVAASSLGLHSEAIFTLADAGFWDDLSLRFPLAHRPLVSAAASENRLPQAWLYAVIRQESAFDADVASHAGATGLMQLMPATAREVAARVGRPAPTTLDLIDPRLNIALGSHYLSAMAARFDGHPVVATAAYNAGPGAVARWLPDAPMPADLWIAAIPYPETRDYVRRVLGYWVIYAERLGAQRPRVGALLRPVQPRRPRQAATGER